MTRRAAFALKHPLPSFRNSVKSVRVRRRLEGVQVQRQGVKLFIAVAAPCRRIRQSLEPWRVCWNKSVVIGKRVAAVTDSPVHRRITHEIVNRALALETSAV